MSRRALPAALAAAACLALAACGGGSSSISSISAPDRAACDTLNRDSTPSPDPAELNTAFGLQATQTGLSAKLAPYAQLVGGSAQLELSGYSGDSRLGEMVGQMRGVCEAMQWKASS